MSDVIPQVPSPPGTIPEYEDMVAAESGIVPVASSGGGSGAEAFEREYAHALARRQLMRQWSIPRYRDSEWFVIFDASTPFTRELSQLILDYSQPIVHFDTNAHSDQLEYSNGGRTVTGTQPRWDIVIAMIHEPLIVPRTAKHRTAWTYEFTVHKKSDECWIGVTADSQLSADDDIHTLVGRKDCWSYYGGREYYVTEYQRLKVSERDAPDDSKSGWTLADGPWGSLHTPAVRSGGTGKFESYSAGDRVALCIDRHARTMTVLKNDRVQHSTDQLPDIHTPLYAFVTIDKIFDSFTVDAWETTNYDTAATATAADGTATTTATATAIATTAVASRPAPLPSDQPPVAAATAAASTAPIVELFDCISTPSSVSN